jgi:BASS family bile acid:Na+ symporter
MIETWIQLLIPLVLVGMMASMGTELAPADFRRMATVPRPVVVGLLGQLVLLPLLGLLMARFGGLPPALAVGAVLITACPGGAPSNVFTYLAGGNVALSVTLTAISSLVTVVTIPLWVGYGVEWMLGERAAVSVPLARMFGQLLVVSVLPIGAGMLVRHRLPEFAGRVRPYLRRFVAILMFTALVLIVVAQWETIVRDLRIASRAAFMLVFLALAIGYALALVSRLTERDAFTISIEVGLQNAALATFIAVNTLERPEFVVLPGAYALLSFVPVSIWTAVHRTFSGYSNS